MYYLTRKKATLFNSEQEFIIAERSVCCSARLTLQPYSSKFSGLGSGIVFLIFRQRTSTIQGLIMEEQGLVSANMVRWARRLHQETIVLVEGVVQVPKGGQEEVRSTTIHKLEVKVHKVPTY